MERRVVGFFSRSAGPERLLSNFARCPVELASGRFHTGEAAFQYHKMLSACDAIADPARRQRVLLAAARVQEMTDPLEAKRAASKRGCGFSSDEMRAWDDGGAEQVQREICRYKYRHCAELRALVASCWPCTLLHQDNRARESTPWGARIDRATGRQVGMNRLGVIWMDEVALDEADDLARRDNISGSQ